MHIVETLEKTILKKDLLKDEISKIQSFISSCKLDKKSTSSIIAKRTGDMIISLFVIVFVLSWITPVLSFIIWLETKHGPFFIQERVGQNNRIYKCIKFRTMYENAQADTKAAIDGDKRITKTGKFLRVSGIDELPQFINVLLGDMSLIGPRPHMLSDTLKFENEIAGYNKRHLVKPGISGLAQIKGYKGPIHQELELYKRIENDILYVRDYSIGLDIKITFLTFYHIIKEISKL